MPCMYLELAVGQYFQLGNIGIWASLSPYMKGIGFSVILVNILMLSYYNTLQAYALYFLVNSFQFTVPWNSCDQKWNTKACSSSSLTINRSSRCFEYFYLQSLYTCWLMFCKNIWFKRYSFFVTTVLLMLIIS